MAATLPCRKWVLSRDAGSAVIAVGPGALVKLAGDGECNAGEQRHGNEGAGRHDPNLVLGLIVHRALPSGDIQTAVTGESSLIC